MKKLALLFALWCLTPIVGYAQGYTYVNEARGPSGAPIGRATVTVCQEGATGLPCTPLATIYTSSTLVTAKSNPFTTDGLGNYQFSVAPGNYVLTITRTGIAGYTIPLTIPCVVDSVVSDCVSSGISWPLTSTTANPATAGQIRLAKTDFLNWRNNANTLNLPFGINVSDQLTFNSLILCPLGSTTTQVLFNLAGNCMGDAGMIWDNTGKTLYLDGPGVTTDVGVLNVDAFQSGNVIPIGITVAGWVSGTGASTIGISSQGYSAGSGNIAALTAIKGYTRHAGTGTLALATGSTYYNVTMVGAGTLTDAQSVRVQSPEFNTAVTNNYGLFMGDQSTSVGLTTPTNPTNASAIYIANQAQSGAFAINSQGGRVNLPGLFTAPLELNSGIGFLINEGAAPSTVSGKSVIYADSTSHTLKVSNNGGGFQDFLFGTVTVPGGGTGLTSVAAGSLLCGNGTGALQIVTPGIAAEVLTANGGTACPSFQAAGGGAATALSGITAGGAANTIGSGDFNQRWNWQLTTNGGTGFYIGESAASSATGSYLFRSSTLATSTASPFRADSNGNGLTMDVNGRLNVLGTGSLNFAALSNFPAACSNEFVRTVGLTNTCDPVDLTVDVTGVAPFANGGTNTANAPVKRLYLSFAGCNNGVAAPGWDLPTAAAMNPACKTDAASTVQGTLQAAANSIAYSTLIIPADFASFNSARIVFTTTTVTNGQTIIFNIATACTNPNATVADTPAYNANNAFTTITIGGGAVANAAYNTTAGTVTGTGCAAGYILHLRLSRSGADTASDTGIALTGGLLLSYNGTYQ